MPRMCACCRHLWSQLTLTSTIYFQFVLLAEPAKRCGFDATALFNSLISVSWLVLNKAHVTVTLLKTLFTAKFCWAEKKTWLKVVKLESHSKYVLIWILLFFNFLQSIYRIQTIFPAFGRHLQHLKTFFSKRFKWIFN